MGGRESRWLQSVRRYYNGWYADGGWDYDDQGEREFLQQRILRPLEIEPGLSVLDLGCGRGLHSQLWYELGHFVTAMDISDEAIHYARRHYHGPTFLRGDARELLSAVKPFDVVFARGMSWFHYRLDGVNEKGVDVPATTAHLFRLLKPSGLFILQIATDFTGTRAPTGVWNNSLDHYRRLLGRFGRIVRSTNWSGTFLTDSEQARAAGGNMLIIARKGRDRVADSARS